MPKNPSKAEVANFIGGLVTEASELSFPPNASPDILNFEHNKDGSIQRRLGMDLEPAAILISPPAADNGINEVDPVAYKWSNAGGISDLSFLVLQFDNELVFYNLDFLNLSSDGYVSSIQISDLPKDTRFDMTTVDGKLVVVAGVENIAIVSYVNGAFAVEYGKLKTRDLWGLENTDPMEGAKLENDPLYRPLSDVNTHLYNLQNQSWGTSKTSAAGTPSSPISLYKSIVPFARPSNSEQVWAGMQYKPDSNGNPTERYYPEMSRDLYGTTSTAAKGFFVIEVIDRGGSRKRALDEARFRDVTGFYPYTLPNRSDYTDGGATFVSEFAGRVFYGGFTGATVGGDRRSPNLSNHVFFSQLVKSTNDIFKCYQQGDPTSRDESDILDTDGGFIRLSGVEKIVGMVPVESKLLVICSNGVWSITGGSDYGFSATNYRVDKISSFGCIAPDSIVEEKGRVFYWGEEGIFAIAKDQFGDYGVDSITRGRIDTYYQAIPIESKTASKGIYDNFTSKVRWLYEQTYDGFTYELILDTQLQSIYPFRISTPNSSVRIIQAFDTSPYNRLYELSEVVSGSDEVIADTFDVIVDGTTTGTSLLSTKYLIRVGNQFTFGYYRAEDFRDFSSLAAFSSDAKAHVLTGAITANDSSIRKQVQFLTLHFKQTSYFDEFLQEQVNNSSCLGQSRWDWANSADSLKWGAMKQLFRNPKPKDIDTFNVVTTRNMLRGQGRALSIYFETEPEKDCHIIGWNLAIDGNAKV